LGRADPGAPSHGRTVAKKDHSARAVRLFRKQAPKQRRRSSLRPPASAVAMTIDQSRITKSCAEHLGSCAAARTTSPLHGTGGSPERRHVQTVLGAGSRAIYAASRAVAQHGCRLRRPNGHCPSLRLLGAPRRQAFRPLEVASLALYQRHHDDSHNIRGIVRKCRHGRPQGAEEAAAFRLCTGSD
jgi:hypothetical protein